MIEKYETSKENGIIIDKNMSLKQAVIGLDEKKDLNKINSIKSNGSDIAALHTKVEEEDTPGERVKFLGIGDDESISLEDSSDEKLPAIPDGGWGWVVVLAAFLVAACADGLAFSFGLLHEEFIVYFNATQSKTSLIGSLFMATPLLAGPIAGALVDRYGCRVMTMIAGILSTIGFLLSAVSNSIEMLCLTFGVLSGLAISILYVTAIVPVAFWFDKKRNLAVSVASCGVGFGTLLYSPMTNYFLELYDWRNTIVLLAGTLLNTCVCGALMRNPEWLDIKMRRERTMSKSRSRKSSTVGSIGSRSIGGESVFLEAEELKALLKSGKSPEYILSTLATSIAEAEQLEATTQMNAEQSFKRMHSAIHLPTFMQQNEKVPAEVIEKLMSNKSLYNIILQNYPEILTRRKSEVYLTIETSPDVIKNEPAQLPAAVKIKAFRTESKSKKSQDKLNEESKKEGQKPESKNGYDGNVKIGQDKIVHKPHTSRRDIMNVHQMGWFRQVTLDRHYLKEMPLYRNTLMHRGAMLNIPRHKLRASSLPDMYRNSVHSLASESDDEMKWYHRLWETLKSTFNFRMYTEFHFFMFNLSSLILSVWFIPPYFYLKSFMTQQHVEGGALMISIIGVASAIGILSLGWAGDLPWVNVTKAYALCIIVSGLAIFCYPLFITNFWALAVISAVFGFSFASTYSYTPAILLELMPIEYFTVAFGMILLVLGIGHLIGPPIAGLLFDVSGTWDLTFYAAGIWMVVAGVCVGVIAYTPNTRLCGSAPLLKDTESSRSDADA